MKEKTMQKKSLLAMILALVMTTSMFPLVVLADTTLTIDSPRDANTTLYTGDAFTLSVSDPDFSSSTTNHIDWTSSDTSVATIGKHNGNVSIVNAGAVTFTATVMDGAKPSGNGTGGGNGSNCTASTGYETATISFTVAQSSTYGYQGTGGNTMLLTALNGTAVSATNVTAGILYSGSSISGYNNTINSPTASAGTVSFGFTMSAGVNNFQPTNFNNNCVGEITIYYYDDEEEDWVYKCGVDSVSSANFD
ncbi:MAG: Ig-like domain-containing protein, partial [Clostridia bacterium]|nr:Ig-like domain-containing protein [Clostridia bacterium]